MNQESAVVTGGQRGLGKAIAEALRGDGLTVNAPSSDDLDVADRQLVDSYFADHRELDLLVCNAGIARDKPLMRMRDADWQDVMQVNLKGAFYCARAVVRGMMKQQRGHIVFISSYSALHPPVGQANYAASKAALIGMMKSMAKELGPRNIRVNAVLPGFLETGMTQGLSDAAKFTHLNRHALGRFNTAGVVGDFISCLHRQMPHTSGQVFNLDSRPV